jgi:disulfide bond formation protein DsbB
VSQSVQPNDRTEEFTYAYAAFTVAAVAALGSLFFGEVMNLPPCTLCWYQRICLFPLTVILAVGIVLRDARLSAYCMPLVLAGLGISIYHNLLYFGVIPETLSLCTEGVSCSTRQIELLGFITIPLMALLAFSAILVSLVVHGRLNRKTEERAPAPAPEPVARRADEASRLRAARRGLLRTRAVLRSSAAISTLSPKRACLSYGFLHSTPLHSTPHRIRSRIDRDTRCIASASLNWTKTRAC